MGPLMPSSFARSALLAVAFVAGCASVDRIAPGTPAAAVESSSGRPARVWQEPGGGASWEYPMGPMGRYTYMVRFGPDARVTQVDQVLGWNQFTRIQRGMTMDAVEHMLGRPYSRVYMPLANETAWSWRFMETVFPRCFYVYEGPDHLVAGTDARDESSGTLGTGLEIPC